MSKVFEWIVEHFPWSSFVAFLRRIGPRRAGIRLLCILLIVAAAGFGWHYYKRVTLYEEMIRGTLKRESMSTPQNYKGLEAFIMAALPPDADGDLAKKTLSDPFVDAFRTLTKDIASAKLEAPANLHVSLRSNGGIVLTDDVTPGFLFLPLHSLRPTLTKDQRAILEKRPGDKEQKALVDRIVKADPELDRDVAFTAAFAPTLGRLAHLSVTADSPDRPAQVYIITKNGLNRILNANGNSSPYQFPDDTFFPSRPYFWPVFAKYNARFAERLEDIAPRRGNTVANQFRISKPYMDLGGAGLVVTLAKGIRIDGYPLAVLCIDLPVRTDISVTSVLMDRIKRFGGVPLIVDCDIRETAPNARCRVADGRDLKPEEDILLADMEKRLRESLRDGRRSDITGNILVLNSTADTDQIEASLPLASMPDPEEHERFLIIGMNLVSYRRNTTWFGFAALACMASAASLLIYFWAVRSSGYRTAFEEVAKLMEKSPIPYLHLDSQDRIRYASDSFKLLIGWPAEDDDLLSRTTLAELLADDSKRKYDDVEEKRRRHEPVKDYVLFLKHRNGASIKVHVFSAAIPNSEGGSLPETFGILLDARAMTVVPLEIAAGHRPTKS